MAFDGIVLKKVVDELSYLLDYKIDKIFQPDKNTIILGLYGNFQNVALLSCISSNNYRIHLTTHTIKNPDSAPNFCMLLRKHILGYKIKKIYCKSLERIVYIELINSENPDKPIEKTLIVELMGKHSNIILTDKNRIIIDAIRHTSTEENSQRDIYPTARYLEPISKKYDILECKNFEDFYEKLKNFKYDEFAISDNLYENMLKKIVYCFNGISTSNLQSILSDDNINCNYLNLINSSCSELNIPSNSYFSEKSFAHTIFDKIKDFLNQPSSSSFPLCFVLDDYYFSKETEDLYKNYRNTLLNIILSTLKKYEKRLSNIDDKLLECKDLNKYKLYGELITANLYKIPQYNVSELSLENYYDNNKLIIIPLDKQFSPQINANKFFKKYNKLKHAIIIVNDQKKETVDEINYIESLVYEIDNCSCIDDLMQVYNEIEGNEIFASSFSKFNNSKNRYKKKKSPKKMTSNKEATFNPLKYVIDGYTIYVGKNNKENDYLTNKFASKNDIWFHTKDTHGSHVILRVKSIGEKIPENILYEAAKLAVSHSKAKNSSNVPVDYCLVQFVKRIPGNHPGLVTYKNNKTIYI